MRAAAVVISAAGFVLVLAPPLRAQDTCPADLQKLQSAAKHSAPGGTSMPTLNPSELEKQIKLMEECRWNHSGSNDNPEPYQEMLTQLKDELIDRYRSFVAKRNLTHQFERDESAGAR